MSGKPNKQDLEQLLSSYIDGECSEQERRQVEEALQRDPQLRALYTDLVRTVEAVRATPAEPAPGHVPERILAQLERRALLGAGPRGIEGARPAAWTRLGLVAAAMLVTAVGVTWWFRAHQPAAPYRMAMAPPPEQDTAHEDLSPLGATGSLPARALTPQIPSGAQPGGVATPQVPVVADRADSGTSYASQVPATVPEDAVAMRNRYTFSSKAPAPSANQGLTIRLHADAAPPAEGETEEATPEGFAAGVAAQGLAPERATAEAPRPAEPAASPARPADLADHEGTTGMASARTAAASAPAPAVAGGSWLSHVAGLRAQVRAKPKLRAAGPRKDEIEECVSLTSDTQPGLPVTHLQVTVEDARHVAEAAEYIRAAVGREGGRVHPQANPSTIIATVPAERQQNLADAVVLAPGVTWMRSSPLPPDDPLARQAASFAAVQWLETVRQFMAAAQRYLYDPAAQPAVPQEQTALVIVITPGPAAARQTVAASQPAGPEGFQPTPPAESEPTD